MRHPGHYLSRALQREGNDGDTFHSGGSTQRTVGCTIRLEVWRSMKSRDETFQSQLILKVRGKLESSAGLQTC